MMTSPKPILLCFCILFSAHLTYGRQVELILKQGHMDTINCVKYAPDGRFFLTGSKDKTLKLWDVATGNLVRTFRGQKGAIKSIDFSTNMDFILSAGTEGEMIKWDLSTGEILNRILAHAGGTNTLDLSPDNKSIATGGVDKLVKIWDAGSGELLTTINKHKFNIISVAFSNKGDKLVTAGYKSKETLLWETQSYKQIGKYPCMGCGKPTVVEFSPDDAEVMIARGGRVGAVDVGSVQTWDANKKAIFWKKYWAPFPQTFATYSKDMQYILAGGVGGQLALYKLDEVENRKNMALQYQPPIYRLFKGHISDIYSVQISPDGKYVLTASRDRSFILWDILSGRAIRKYTSEIGIVNYVHVPKNPNHLYSANLGGMLKLWDLRYGKLLKSYIDVKNVSVIAINEAETLAAYSEPDDRAVLIHDLVNEKELKRLWANTGTVDNIQFTPDGQYVLTASGTQVRQWDLSTFKRVYEMTHDLQPEKEYNVKGGKLVKEGKEINIKDNGNVAKKFVHESLVNSYTVSNDKEWLITGTSNGTINIWDINSGKTLVNMIPMGESDYFTVTPDYYYTCSKQASQSISFTKGLETYSFDQFDFIYNRPDIVLGHLGKVPDRVVKSYESAYKKRLKKLNIDPSQDLNNLQLPELDIDLSAIPLISPDQVLKVEYDASDKAAKLDRLNVYVNEVPVFGPNGYDLSQFGQNEYSGEISIELSRGINVITIAVMNEKGLESAKTVFEVQYGDEDPIKPNLYLVTIGVSKYAQQEYNLAFAAKDANDLNGVLSGAGVYGQVYSKVITNENATKQNISDLKDFLAKSTVDDVIVFFIAGHGVLDSEFNYYFATYDIDFLQPEISGMSFSELEGLLYASKSRKKTLFMDTCHSGELDKDDIESAKSQEVVTSGAVAFRAAGEGVQFKEGFGLENSLRLSQNLFSDLRKGTGATIVSAAGGTEFAMEGLDSDNGLFTSLLIKGLTSGQADENKDEQISISEIYKYVTTNVSALSGGKQVPMTRAENLKNNFTIY